MTAKERAEAAAVRPAVGTEARQSFFLLGLVAVVLVAFCGLALLVIRVVS